MLQSSALFVGVGSPDAPDGPSVRSVACRDLVEHWNNSPAATSNMTSVRVRVSVAQMMNRPFCRVYLIVEILPSVSERFISSALFDGCRDEEIRLTARAGCTLAFTLHSVHRDRS